MASRPRSSVRRAARIGHGHGRRTRRGADWAWASRLARPPWLLLHTSGFGLNRPARATRQVRGTRGTGAGQSVAVGAATTRGVLASARKKANHLRARMTHPLIQHQVERMLYLYTGLARSLVQPVFVDFGLHHRNSFILRNIISSIKYTSPIISSC
jgi:hypothetical protein